MSNAFSFPGARTQWASEPAATVTGLAPLAEIEAQAVAEASGLAGKVGQLRAQADAYAAQAYAYIDRAAGFNERIGKVTYVVPDYNGPDLREMGGFFGAAPSISAMPSMSMAAYTSALDGGTFSSSATPSEPTIGALPEVVPPSASTISMAPPLPPPPIDVIIKPAPALSIDVDPIPSVPGIGPAPDILFDGHDLGPGILPAHIPTIDDEDIETAIDRLRSLTGRAVTIPGYAQRFPEVFSVTGSLLSGETVFDSDEIIAQADERNQRASADHDRIMTNLWADRGLPARSDAVVSPYNQVMQSRNSFNEAADNAAAKGRLLDDALREAFRLGVAAHGMMIDMELALYDAEFEALMLVSSSALVRAKAVVAAYNAVAAQFNAEIDRVGVGYSLVEARAGRHRARADIAGTRSRLNTAIADAFSAQERGKQADAKLFSAKVGVNEARDRGFASRMRAIASQASAMKADAERYKADVLMWEAGAERTQLIYKQASARARAVVAQNQAEATKARLSQVRNELVSAEARKLATMTTARAAEIRAQIAERVNAHVSTEAINQTEAIKTRALATHYEGRVLQWSAGVEAKSALLDGKAVEMDQATRFFAATMESHHRAATLTQQADQQLSEAYRVATEAAARAGAAVESGRLSGFRATASLRASADYGAKTGFRLSGQQGYYTGIEESDRKNTRVKST